MLCCCCWFCGPRFEVRGLGWFGGDVLRAFYVRAFWGDDQCTGVSNWCVCWWSVVEMSASSVIIARSMVENANT